MCCTATVEERKQPALYVQPVMCVRVHNVPEMLKHRGFHPEAAETNLVVIRMPTQRFWLRSHFQSPTVSDAR